VPGGDFLSILFIAIGLAADCFAVALGAGVSRKQYSRLGVLRMAFSFGLFQVIMLVLGWLAGRTVVELIAAYDHWVAFGLLAVVSGRMFWEAFHADEDEEKAMDVTRGVMLLTLSVATSIDSLAVGLSFAFLEINMALASPTTGAVTFVFTIAGFIIGGKGGKLIGKRAEALGGIILLVIAFRILLSHLL
jgi:putative Mn2+ efflux pump MntP